MSLLAGIKFIPKGDRKPSSSHETEDKAKSSKDRKKSKKREKKYNYSSDDSDVDMNSFLEEKYDDKPTPSPSKRMDWMSRDGDEISSKKAKNNDSSTNILNVDKFRSLLTSLKPKEDPVKIPLPSSTSSSIGTSDSKLSENQSMAAKLRSQLKDRKGPLQAADISSTSNKIMTRHLMKPNVKSNADSSLKSMVMAERNGGDDMDANLRNNIIHMGDKYNEKMLGSGNRAGMDEDEDISTKLYEQSQTSAITQRNQVIHAIKQDEKLKSHIKHCPHCIDSSKYRESSSYTIALGQYTYLRLKAGGLRLHPLHCEILPIQHSSSIRQCEEEVVTEINRFKSCIRRLADASRISVIFTEAATQYHKMQHATIDCIPVENEKEVIACFKDAFISSGEEWSQHKKMIELRADRPLHRAIPPQFEYLVVEWGDYDDASYAGLVHPIEVSTSAFDRYFCLDVVGGMLDDDPMRMKVKMPVDHSIEENYIECFRKKWDRYDWTKYYDQPTES